ncbi:hypothetical protein LTR08_009273 [Meristemomyces frigidus]|nr:hypothetical protein LTR08_009273 [Meristemomyces frigidus]
MADPFSIVAGAVGIFVVAIQGIVIVHDLITSLHDAFDGAASISADLNVIRSSLGELGGMLKPMAATSNVVKPAIEHIGLAQAVNNLGEVCTRFEKQFKRWTKHSTEARKSVRDRVRLGWLNQAKIKTFGLEVEMCKGTATLAVSIATFKISIQTSDLLSLSKATQLEQLKRGEEKRIQEALDQCQRQTEAVIAEEDRLTKALDNSGNDACGHDDYEDEIEQAIAEMRKEIGNIDLGVLSKALVGIPDSVVGRIHSKVGDVKTGEKAKLIAGVYMSNFSANDFMRN